ETRSHREGVGAAPSPRTAVSGSGRDVRREGTPPAGGIESLAANRPNLAAGSQTPLSSQTKKGPALRGPLFCLAGGPGFEPGLTESESVVLPLDDPPMQ